MDKYIDDWLSVLPAVVFGELAILSFYFANLAFCHLSPSEGCDAATESVQQDNPVAQSGNVDTQRLEAEHFHINIAKCITDSQ